MSLAEKRCIPCEGGALPLTQDEAVALLIKLDGWSLSENSKEISKKFTFKDFRGALDFVNAVGEIAEAENHHPDIEFGWGKARLRLSTHAIGGLSENDFIVAAKIDRMKGEKVL